MKPEKKIGFWGAWCEVHHGPPPFGETTVHVCPQCGRSACDMDFFETETGFLCGECVNRQDTTPLNALFKQRFELVKARSRVSKITIVVTEFLILLFVVLTLVDGSFRSGIIQSSIGFLMIMFGVLILTLFSLVLALLQLRQTPDNKSGGGTL